MPTGVTACLFDLDGVLTQTAKVHSAAWKQMFDDYLRERAPTGPTKPSSLSIRSASTTNTSTASLATTAYERSLPRAG